MERMTSTVDPLITLPDGRTYRVAAIAHGKALLMPLTHGAAHVIPISRLAQAAAAPTPN